MQLKAIVVSALCSVALCSHVQKRDAKPVVEALGSISSAVKNLTASLTASGDKAKTPQQLILQAQDLLRSLNGASADLKIINPFTIAESAPILQPGNALIADVQKTVQALIARKPDFDKQNLSGAVAQEITNFKTGSANLVSTIVSKMPAAIGSVAETIGKNINIALDKGLAVYSGAPSLSATSPSIFTTLGNARATPKPAVRPMT